jgi:hypothetical protein
LQSSERMFPSESDYGIIKYLQEDTTKDTRPQLIQANLDDTEMAEFVLESKCAEIFAKAPYKFKPRTNKPLDYEIAR